MLDTDLPELGLVRIARPCSQKWSNMTGDDQVRRCAACKCSVFNFAELSSEEARQLIRRTSEGERICARIFKRLDGTVMTKDCPRGYSHGWRYARKLLPTARGLGWFALVAIALLVVTVTLFGDNIRRLFATSAGGLAASEPVARAPKAAGKEPTRLGQHPAY